MIAMLFHCRNEIVTNDIEPSSRYHLLSDGRLMIAQTTQADQGRYGCMASNAAGEATSGQAMLLLQQPARVGKLYLLLPTVTM